MITIDDVLDHRVRTRLVRYENIKSSTSTAWMTWTYIIPISLSLLESGALEPKSTLPVTTFTGFFGQGQLSPVSVPGTQQMNRLDIGGSAKIKRQLSSRHDVGFVSKIPEDFQKSN